MPPLPPTPSPVLKVRLDWQRDGDALAKTIHHFRYSGSTPDATVLSEFAADITTAAESAFAALCDTHTGVNTTTITDVSMAEGLQGIGGTPWVGTRTGGQLAPATSAVVNHQSPRTYRGGKPKSFFPMGTSSDVATNGFWADAFVTEFLGAWSTWWTSVDGLTRSGTTIGEVVNVSYYSGGTTVVISPTTGRARNVPKKRTTPLVEAFAGSTGSKVIGSQRRRNRDA